MKTLSALAAVLFLASASSPAAPFSLSDLERILSENGPKTMEDTLPLLPESFRRNAVLMKESRSLQNASPDEPRALLSNEDGSFVLAFNGYGSTFEMIQYHRKERRFEFAEVEFRRDGSPEVRHDVSGCSGCHGNSDDPHPVFESFPKWPGAYGEDGERIEPKTEAPALRDFLAASATHPRYRSLVDLEKTHGTLDQEGRLSGRPNSSLLRKLMRLNFDRVADRIEKDPHYPENRYRILAAFECADSPTFRSDFLGGLGSIPDRLTNLETDVKTYRGEAIAFYWILPRLGFPPFDRSLAFGDYYGESGARLPTADSDYGSAPEELARAFAGVDPGIAAIVGRDGRTAPDCGRLRDLVKSR